MALERASAIGILAALGLAESRNEPKNNQPRCVGRRKGLHRRVMPKKTAPPSPQRPSPLPPGGPAKAVRKSRQTAPARPGRWVGAAPAQLRDAVVAPAVGEQQERAEAQALGPLSFLPHSPLSPLVY